MLKKMLSVLICCAVLIPFLISCADTSVTSEPEEKHPVDFDFSVTIGNREFTADYINSEPDEKKISIYNSQYTVGRKPSLSVSGSDSRVLLAIAPDSDNEFSVLEIAAGGSTYAHIPVNGFVISVSAEDLDGLRYAIGSLARVKGYSSLVGQQEDLSHATFNTVSSTALTRRKINIIDPAGSIETGKIYLITNKYEKSSELPDESAVCLVEQTTSSGYNIVSVEFTSVLTAPEGNRLKLILCGEYNLAYAKEYLKEGERIMINNLGSANSYSDIPAVGIGGTVYRFDERNTNIPVIDSKGVYMYDSSFASRVTPECETDERLDIEIVNGVIAYKGESGRPTLIPSGNGITVTAIGKEFVEAFSKAEIGEKADLYLIDLKELSEKYAVINGEIYNIDIFDSIRAPEGVCAIYTPEYGATTGTNQYGNEIVIKNGRVSEVNIGKGNSSIPTDGYVLSIHKDNRSAAFAKSVSVGDEVKLVTSGTDYSVTVVKYDGINTVRAADTLILYRDKISTGTNVYGYEVFVDAEGTAIGDSSSGNGAIPRGGYILSGHGVKADLLRSAYALGAKILLNTDNSEVIIVKTPDIKIANIKSEFEENKKTFESAKKELINIDYKAVQSRLDSISELVSESDKAYEKYDYAAAIEKAEAAKMLMERIDYALIDSHVVENRAMWYRSTEKSDEEVRATLTKLKNLHVNALYLETWYEGTCPGFIDVEGVKHSSANGNYDALEGFIRLGHEMGIEIHAWVENFFVGFTASKNGPNGNADTFTSKMASLFADKLLIDKAGRNYFYYHENASFVFMNPFDAECRAKIIEIYKELVTKYGIDGLHLDYIRFPELNYIDGVSDFGYNEDIIAAFAKETGIVSDPHNFKSGSSEQKAWIDFRCSIITGFVKEVRDAILKINPDIWISAATYPNVDDAHDNIFQDVRTWVKNGWMDEVFSMSYGTDNEYVGSNAAAYASFCKNNCFYSTGVSAFSKTLPGNFAKQLTEVRTAGSDGVSVFSLANIAPGNYQHEITEGAFRESSVQAYKVSQTVFAGLKGIGSKLDNLNGIFSLLNADDIKAVKEMIAPVIESAEKFNTSSASAKEKIAYCKQAIADLNGISSSITERFGNNAEANEIIEDIETVIYYTSLILSRLESR